MSQLLAGTSRADITPPFHIPYLGFWPRQSLFEGVHDPLTARALVLSREDTTLAIIATDAIGWANELLGPGRHFRNELCALIGREAPIPPDSVMLTATHCHSSPETTGITRLWEVEGAVEWLEEMQRTFAALVVDAYRNRRPACVKVGAGRVTDVACSRRVLGKDGRLYHNTNRPPDDQIADPGLADERMAVLAVEMESPAECAAVLNFSCHAVTVQAQPMVSADFPGLACRLVEEKVEGCRNCLFLQGACGDINPVDGDRGFDYVPGYGERLAAAAARTLGQMAAEEPCCEPGLRSAYEEIRLPAKPTPDLPTVEARELEARRQLEASEEFTSRVRGPDWARWRRAGDLLDAVRRLQNPVIAPLQVFRIGPALLCAHPSELFTAWGLEMKKLSQELQVFVVGYANGYVGYIPTKRDFEIGGYETTLAPWGLAAPGAGELILDRMSDLVERATKD